MVFIRSLSIFHTVKKYIFISVLPITNNKDPTLEPAVDIFKTAIEPGVSEIRTSKYFAKLPILLKLLFLIQYSLGCYKPLTVFQTL